MRGPCLAAVTGTQPHEHPLPVDWPHAFQGLRRGRHRPGGVNSFEISAPAHARRRRQRHGRPQAARGPPRPGRHRRVGHRHLLRGAPPGLRPGRASARSSTGRRPRSSPWSSPGSSSASASPSTSATRWRRSTPRRPTVTSRNGLTDRLRRPGAGHRLVPVRPPAAGQRRPRVLRLPHPRRPGGHPGLRQVGCRAGAVVGGGLLGLEAANALQCLGLETHVVEFADRLMPMQVDDGGSSALRRRIEDLGVTIHTGMRTEEILARPAGPGAGHALRQRGPDGPIDDLKVGMVVFSAGIRPRDELAKAAGLRMGERGGVVVDEACRTSDPRIYAIGECALAPDGGTARRRIYGLVAPGYHMARVVADRILGGDAAFTGRRHVDQAQAARHRRGQLRRRLRHRPRRRGRHLQRPRGQRLPSAFVAASAPWRSTYSDPSPTSTSGWWWARPTARTPPVRRDAGRRRRRLPDARADVPGRHAHARAPRGADLPRPHRGGAAHHGRRRPVRHGHDLLLQQRRQGRHLRRHRRAAPTTVGAIKACTKAGTGCGGCVPLVTELLRVELKRLGLEVEQRPVRALRLHPPGAVRHRPGPPASRSFAELVTSHGTGQGCEICKPAVASMLASLGGGYILDGEQAALQDTNDHFLANLQRDGTYSVVPRVPGGEITPDQLIAIGEVAQDFDLYTKITGGQRIDLFGARVDQLPLIWRRLIDAGLESGHAYGKALRTVKSCVGNTWCRFGVQDSVTLAIDLELRYRGLRAPHKLKAAVSGCARECAEAQSKDFGVIATERGWNVYVGGNGGMQPQHAELLAEDLDRETVVPLPRPLPDVLRPHRRPAGAHRRLVQQAGGRHRPPPAGGHRRRPRHLRRARGRDGPPRRHLRVRVEGHPRRPRAARALPLVRQLRRGRPQRGLRHRAGPAPARPSATRSPTRPCWPRAHGDGRPSPRPRVDRRSGSTSARSTTSSPTGACAALVDGHQVAVFLLSTATVYALDNLDPFSQAFVLSRGIVGVPGRPAEGGVADLQAVASTSAPAVPRRRRASSGARRSGRRRRSVERPASRSAHDRRRLPLRPLQPTLRRGRPARSCPSTPASSTGSRST